jgi:hypothetical protein
MDQQILQLGATAVVAIVAFKVIEKAISEVMKTLRKKDESEQKRDEIALKHPLCAEIISLSALFKSHEEVQKETFATIHNGLNTNAGAIKEIAYALGENTKAIAVLTAIINERIPKKQ